jgi:hypothetical protein
MCSRKSLTASSRLDRPDEATGPFGLIDFLSERTRHFACDLSPHLRHRTALVPDAGPRALPSDRGRRLGRDHIRAGTKQYPGRHRGGGAGGFVYDVRTGRLSEVFADQETVTG